ncbi:MAG: Bug family tripartite tricarboxylate transporter substrate binding protein [Burkholderiales bacterium]
MSRFRLPPALRVGFLLAGALSCSLPSESYSQAYPVKPVRLLTLFAAGSTGDASARVFAGPFGDALGQQVVLENVPGAGGVLAAERVARAAPDGYTLLYSLSSVHVMRPYLARQTPFDPVNDFTPITQIGTAITLLVANTSAPYRSFRELIDYAKANPGKVSYGTSGVGSPTHLAGELIGQLTQINIVHVPYKAVSQAFQDVMGGQLPLAFAISSQVLPAIKSGKIRVLAVMEDDRYNQMPDIPSMQEVVANFQAPPSWPGLFAPAKLPPPILQRLHAEAVKVLNSNEVKEKLATRDFYVSTQKSPEEFLAKIKREMALVGRVVKSAGIQPTD